MDSRSISKLKAQWQRKILTLLKDGRRRRALEISQHFGISITRTVEALNALQELGVVRRCERIDETTGTRNTVPFFYCPRNEDV